MDFLCMDTGGIAIVIDGEPIPASRDLHIEIDNDREIWGYHQEVDF